MLGSKVQQPDWPMWPRANGVAANVEPLLFESTTLAIQTALRGLRIVICTPACVQGDVVSGRLVALPGRMLRPEDCYWLILPGGRTSAPLRIVADWLVGEASLEADGTPLMAPSSTY